MSYKSPYDIIKTRYVTEKTQVLSSLHKNESNACVKKCNTPKHTFLVDTKANKKEIATAIEAIYAEFKIHVIAVNTINSARKPRRVKGRRLGFTRVYKKAIVTLEAGDEIPENL